MPTFIEFSGSCISIQSDALPPTFMVYVCFFFIRFDMLYGIFIISTQLFRQNVICLKTDPGRLITKYHKYNNQTNSIR